MTTITDIFTREVGEDARGTGQETYSPSPRASCPFCKVIEAILRCRTGEYGSTVYQCQSCGQTHTIHCSCGNRHCPQCQHHKTRGWLEKQLDRQLPGPHFLITFTVPEELRDFIRSIQKCATKPCSRLPPKPSRSWPETRGSSGRICPDSPASCTRR